MVWWLPLAVPVSMKGCSFSVQSLEQLEGNGGLWHHPGHKLCPALIKGCWKYTSGTSKVDARIQMYIPACLKGECHQREWRLFTYPIFFLPHYLGTPGRHYYFGYSKKKIKKCYRHIFKVPRLECGRSYHLRWEPVSKPERLTEELVSPLKFQEPPGIWQHCYPEPWESGLQVGSLKIPDQLQPRISEVPLGGGMASSLADQLVTPILCKWQGPFPCTGPGSPWLTAARTELAAPVCQQGWGYGQHALLLLTGSFRLFDSPGGGGSSAFQDAGRPREALSLVV